MAIFKIKHLSAVVVGAAFLVGCGGGGSDSSGPSVPNAASTNAPPIPSFESSCTDARVCSFTSTSTDPDGTIASVLWTFPGGSTATTTETSFTFDEYGSYLVSLEATDNSGASRARNENIGVFVDLDNAQSSINKDHESIIFLQDFDHRAEGNYDIESFRDDICYNTNIQEYCGGYNSDEGIVYEIVQGQLKVTFDANRTMGAGINRLFESEYQELYMTYRVWFSENYDFTSDMKINGLGGSIAGEQVPGGGSGTSGGDGGFNSRYVFRDAGLKQYVYHPNQSGDYGDSEYVQDVTDGTGRFEFSANKTYTIEMRVKMNSAGQLNGEIETFVNGVSVLLQDDFSFSGSGVYGINRFMVNFFVSENTGLSETASFYLDDIAVSTERIVESAIN